MATWEAQAYNNTPSAMKGSRLLFYIMITIIWQTFLFPIEGQFPQAVDFVQVTSHLLLHLVQQVLVKVGVKNNSVINLSIYHPMIVAPVTFRSCELLSLEYFYLWGCSLRTQL